MLARRIIPCLDVRDGVVVKGVAFRNHVVLGGVLELARRYRDASADELVFYDITASAERRLVATDWVGEIARFLDIPFCVAGGIRSVDEARRVLHAGADKVSVNSPAHERPELIDELAAEFGSQCVVVGVDSRRAADGSWLCWELTGSESTARTTAKQTLDWVVEVAERGAGEIVLNAMGSDGAGAGYDLEQLSAVRQRVRIPVVASGGAGGLRHFVELFEATGVEAALAAGVFHRGELSVAEVKQALFEAGIEVRRG